MVIGSIIGIADTAYLTIQHYSSGNAVCTFSNSSFFSLFDNCEKVTSSAYAMIGGFMPLALVGFFYYTLALVLVLFHFTRRNRHALQSLCVLTGAGTIASAWFVYLQLAVLHALCLYCMISAVTTMLLFFLSLYLLLSLSKPLSFLHELESN